MSFPDLLGTLGPWTADIRGTLTPNRRLAEVTWFRVGGPAQLYYEPADEADLMAFLEQLPAEIPVTVIGSGSNLLIRDGGIEGVVIRLTAKAFGGVEIVGETRLSVGAGVPDVKIATAAANAGIDGLSFFRGIPGAVGGALYMNAGCYGTETRERVVSLRGVTRQGRVVELTNSDMAYSYRHSDGPAGVIYTRAEFEGAPGEKDEILARMREITEKRESTQPTRGRTGGSTFKNPEGHSAWRLVDEAGCRGLRIGDAQVSELHTNFLLNLDAATAQDIETLGETVRGKVRDRHGIALDWEIRRMGLFAPGHEVREFLDGDVFPGVV
ncbi:UDP-N-acetylmuramate dehydrogenase [Pelagibacterium montanilacus]|uniref:UDP-N-acetylmuramate dehydrogenase n=1 Tax=Pelagibacterium montanilacus TaxID=2185280 RepID=UPI000F8ED912|nr:UDP-N-acetylmuramate dehydrogenase [Pelagibacterium montanilacus]